MTDVRLTALNPEDSQVYPVACNTSGELKLEKQATFDGNLDGDLTVSGTSTLKGGIEISGGDRDSIDRGLYAINNDLEIKASTNVLGIKNDFNMSFVFESNKVTGTGNVIGSYFSFQNTGNFTGDVYGIRSGLGSQGFSSSNNASAFFASCTASNNVSCDGVLSAFSCDIRNNSNNGTGSVYSIYAYGTAPSYFKGNITCDGKINGSFILRMQSDDPGAFTTTYSTDEEGNEVINNVYQGTTEDLLSIIKDLRARVTALEAMAAQ